MANANLDTLVVKIVGDAAKLASVLKEAQKMLGNHVKVIDQQTKQAQQKHNALMAESARITASVATPTEHYRKELSHLKQLLKQGAIDQKTYNRVVEKLRNTLPSVIAANKKLADQQAKANAEAMRATEITERYATAQQKWIPRIAELNSLLKKGLLTQEAYDRAVKGTMKDLGLFQKAEHNKNKELTQENTILPRSSQHLQTFANGLQNVALHLRAVSGSIRMAGYLLSASLTAPIMAFVYKGMSAFSEFDKQMTYSLSIAGKVADDTRKKMEQLAIQMSEQSSFSASELASAYYELISAGLDTEASMKSLHTVEAFAIAGNMDLAQSTKQLAKATASFGMSGKNATEQAVGFYIMANNLVQAANMTTASIQDMTQAFLVAAPQARNVGMSLKEVTALLSYYQIVSTSAAEAGEHASIGLRLIGTAYSEHKDFWVQYGLKLYDATGKTRKFTNVLKDMQAIYLKLSHEARVPFLKHLGFEAMQQRAVNPVLINPESVELMEKFEIGLENETALMEVYEKQMKSFSNQMKTFWHMVQNVSMEIAGMLVPYLQKGIAVVIVAIDFWKGLTNQGKKLVVAFGAVLAAIGPILIGLGTLITISAMVIGSIAAIATALIAIATPVGAVVTAITVVALAVSAVVAGVIAYVTAMTLWPDETTKTLHIVERLFHAFQGWMASVFVKVWESDFPKHAIKGMLKVLNFMSPFSAAINAILFKMGEGAEDLKKQLLDQTVADQTAGALDLGQAIKTILKEELGEDFDIDKFNIADKLRKALNIDNSTKDMTNNFDEIKNGMIGLQKPAEALGGTFTDLSQKLQEFIDKMKEELALQQKFASVGFDPKKFTGKEQELFRLQYKQAEERRKKIEDLRKLQMTPEEAKSLTEKEAELQRKISSINNKYTKEYITANPEQSKDLSKEIKQAVGEFEAFKKTLSGTLLPEVVEQIIKEYDELNAARIKEAEALAKQTEALAKEKEEAEKIRAMQEKYKNPQTKFAETVVHINKAFKEGSREWIKAMRDARKELESQDETAKKIRETMSVGHKFAPMKWDATEVSFRIAQQNAELKSHGVDVSNFGHHKPSHFELQSKHRNKMAVRQREASIRARVQQDLAQFHVRNEPTTPFQQAQAKRIQKIHAERHQDALATKQHISDMKRRANIPYHNRLVTPEQLAQREYQDLLIARARARAPHIDVSAISRVGHEHAKSILRARKIRAKRHVGVGIPTSTFVKDDSKEMLKYAKETANNTERLARGKGGMVIRPANLAGV